MKMPIKWHKECLKNRQVYLLAKMEELNRVNNEVARMRQEIIDHDAQIIEAETRGLDGFDADKFRKKRKRAA